MVALTNSTLTTFAVCTVNTSKQINVVLPVENHLSIGVDNREQCNEIIIVHELLLNCMSKADKNNLYFHSA